MDDKLTALFRQRFTGHEMDVPTGVWEHVSGQLAASASGESLRESLQGKFQGHEVEVDPSAWANISGQLGHGAAAGSSFTAGWIAIAATAVVVTATALLWNTGNTEPKVAPQEKPTVMVQAPIPSSASSTTLPLSATSAPVTKETPAHPTPVKAATSSLRSHKILPVQPAPASDPGTVTAAPAAQTSATTTAPAPEQKVVAVQPTVSSPMVPEPHKQIETATAAGTATPETSGDEEHATTTAKADDTPAERSDIDPFQTAATNDILIPNVFSPQGDGVNDKLAIVARDYDKVDVRVFAAKGGALIFRSNDLTNMWDGRLPNGNIAEEGYYKCVVLLTTLDGPPRVKSEVVRLFR